MTDSGSRTPRLWVHNSDRLQRHGCRVHWKWLGQEAAVTAFAWRNWRKLQRHIATGNLYNTGQTNYYLWITSLATFPNFWKGQLKSMFVCRQCSERNHKEVRRCNMIHEGIREISQLFNNNPQGIWLRRRTNKDGRNVYKQILINTVIKMWKITIGKRGEKNSDW